MQISTHIVSICESRPPGLTLEPAGCGPPRGRNVWRDRGCQGLFQRGWGTGPGRGHRPGTVRALPRRRLHCRLWFPLGQFLLTRVQVNSSSLCLVHPPKERSLHVRGRRLSVRAVCPQEPLGCSPSPLGLVDFFPRLFPHFRVSGSAAYCAQDGRRKDVPGNGRASASGLRGRCWLSLLRGWTGLPTVLAAAAPAGPAQRSPGSSSRRLQRA